MLQKSQDLTKKMRAAESSDESDQEDGVEMVMEEDPSVQSEATSNPWMAPAGKIKILQKPRESQQTAKEIPNDEATGDTPKSDSTSEPSRVINPVVSHSEIEIEEKHVGGGDRILNHDSDLDMDELFSQIEKKRELRQKDKKQKSKKKSAKKRVQEKQNLEKGESKPKKFKKDNGDSDKSKINPKDGSKKKAGKKDESKQKPNKKKSKPEKAKPVESEDSSEEEEELEDPRPSKVGHSSLLEPDTPAQEETLIDTSLTRKQTLEELEVDDWSDDEPSAATESKGPSAKEGTAGAGDIPANAQVDPNKVMAVEHRIRPSHLRTLVEEEEDGEDRDLQHHRLIAEAFAEDNVVDDFAEEKKTVEERDKPKDIDLSLPGWGEWGGTGLQPSARKRKR